MAVTLARLLAPLELTNEPDANGGEQNPNDNVVKWTKARNEGEGEDGCSNHERRRIA